MGEVLKKYDSDNQYPIYGFGARSRALKVDEISHCFSLTGDPKKPKVTDTEGLLKAYNSAVSKVELFGPTCFAPIIKKSCSAIK